MRTIWFSCDFDGAGNRATFAKQIEILLEHDDAEVVYFAEDDYFYLPGQFQEMLEFLTAHDDVDFVSRTTIRIATGLSCIGVRNGCAHTFTSLANGGFHLPYIPDAQGSVARMSPCSAAMR